jgi:hypothetical protein
MSRRLFSLRGEIDILGIDSCDVCGLDAIRWQLEATKILTHPTFFKTCICGCTMIYDFEVKSGARIPDENARRSTSVQFVLDQLTSPYS